jgi:glycerate kinase
MKKSIFLSLGILACLLSSNAFADELIAHCTQTTDVNDNGSKGTVYDVSKTDSGDFTVSITGLSTSLTATKVDFSSDNKTLKIEIAPAMGLQISKQPDSSSVSSAGEDADQLDCTTYW